MANAKKQQVAELLYDLPTGKVSTDLIRWVMSHLPDTDEERGTNSQRATVFKHDEEPLHLAMGMTDRGVLDLALKFQRSFPANEKDGEKKSMIMEKFYPQLTEPEKAYLVSEGIPSFQHFAGHFVVEKFGVEGYETLHNTKLSEEDKRKLLAFVEIGKNLEKIKNLFGGHGQ